MAKLICQAVGCTVERKRWQFMCTAHWKALPGPMRTQVNATWRGFQNRAHGDHQPIIDYREATDEARRWTAEGEGRLADFAPEATRLKALYGAIDGDAE